ncbi:MAG TPA: phospholipase D-like domain-containing protein [Candidatus Rifleibacterium sp.]|nr:phospholipase D-like domain-containing protein [Candidatus Rifleibacterium sp.]HPT46029.1 phospholipase D-like domain-containing protein [Candidatus Rifleibacterium sp.]
MKKFMFSLALASGIFCSAAAFAGNEGIDIYYGPKGGFSKVNNSRVLRFSDASTRPATLANALVHYVDQLERGSSAKICMYSMSDYASLDALIAAAAEKEIKFQLLLDGVSTWAQASRDRIVKMVKEAGEKAKAEGRPFDFKIAAVSTAAMKRNGRESKLEDGTLIYGTMHEKFGIFYRPGNPVPHSCFNGSANISPTSDQIYAENRVFFTEQPVVARQFAEEFARLWNEYSEMLYGEWLPEKYIETSHVPGYVKIVFNSEPANELELTRIDNELINMIRRVDASGSLDLAMFSLTRIELAEAILRAAERNPDAKFRLMLDHAQLDDADPVESKLGPWLETKAAELGLKNIQVRYRFRINAYGYSTDDKKAMLLSYLSLFLHHKNVTVNGREMVIGSYNWSNSAEYLNFENVMLFNGHYNHHQKVIDSFKAEFDVLWNSRMPAGPVNETRKGVPQTVTLAEGKALHKRLLKTLEKEDNYKVLGTMDREAHKTLAQIKEATSLTEKRVNLALKALSKDGFIIRLVKDGVDGYSQAD